jgi:hypothetical protein
MIDITDCVDIANSAENVKIKRQPSFQSPAFSILFRNAVGFIKG